MNAKPVQELVEQLISESEQRTNARLRGIEVTLNYRLHGKKCLCHICLD